MRFFKIPKWSRIIYSGAIWDFFSRKNQSLYLTFDDGPCPDSTLWLLDLLDTYQAKATFFCLGKNVQLHPHLYEEIRKRGHAIGNHGMHHLNGLKTDNTAYLADAADAAAFIHSSLYRPAYGRIKPSQHRLLRKQGFRVVFWSLLSYDFDATFASDNRTKILLKKAVPGSIIVFHDSVKAFPHLQKELPMLLREWASKGYQFSVID